MPLQNRRAASSSQAAGGHERTRAGGSWCTDADCGKYVKHLAWRTRLSRDLSVLPPSLQPAAQPCVQTQFRHALIPENRTLPARLILRRVVSFSVGVGRVTHFLFAIWDPSRRPRKRKWQWSAPASSRPQSGSAGPLLTTAITLSPRQRIEK